MSPDVIYTPYATSSKEKTGGIITFVQFEEGDLKEWLLQAGFIQSQCHISIY